MSIIFLFVMAGVIALIWARATCANPVYVDGMECFGTEMSKTCKPAKVFDHCAD